MNEYTKMIKDLVDEEDIDKRAKLRCLYTFANDLSKRVGNNVLSLRERKDINSMLSLIRRKINNLEFLRRN